MSNPAQLFLPPVPLAGCLFAAIVRDTRGQTLSDLDRFNHFPTSPLIAVTIVLEGDLRIANTLEDARIAANIGAISVAGPQSTPLTSWSEGSIFVMTLGFFPDAWATLTGQKAHEMANKTCLEVPEVIGQLIEKCLNAENAADFWGRFCEGVLPLWTQERGGAYGLSNWAKSVLTRATLASAGQSLRATERRLRRWTGQSQQSLKFFARLDDLHRLSRQEKDVPLAAIALDAGFADQSHMGRTVRRATGFSPAQLNRLIAKEEAFWCYRLLGERY